MVFGYHRVYDHVIRYDQEVMGSIIDDALVERVLTYVPFVVYDGNARCFVLCVQRGYVDATGLGLEHQRVRFASFLTCVYKNTNVESAWRDLENSERRVIQLACPETNDSETGCSELKARLSSSTELHRLVALWQFFAREGNDDVPRIFRTWRFIQVVAAAVKGGSRAKQWTKSAWQSLTADEQTSWMKKFGSMAHLPSEISNRLKAFCSRLVDDHAYLDGLVICPKRCDLLTFHSAVLKVVGSVPKVPEIPEVTFAARRALIAIIDKDCSPFPLALVPLFVNDRNVVAALKDYFQFWQGKKTDAVFKQWDTRFWQCNIAAVFFVTLVVKRYARLKSSLVRFMPFKQPKEGKGCPCETAALYCKDCLELKSTPNFKHPPPGESIAFDVNQDRVVCQLCRSARIIRVPLFNPLNPSLTLCISHPDRNPLHVCDRSPFCFAKTSYVGSCRTCER